MNTYTVIRFASSVLIIKADSYNFEEGFVNFYIGTGKVHSVIAHSVSSIEKQ